MTDSVPGPCLLILAVALLGCSTAKEEDASRSPPLSPAAATNRIERYGDTSTFDPDGYYVPLAREGEKDTEFMVPLARLRERVAERSGGRVRAFP